MKIEDEIINNVVYNLKQLMNVEDIHYETGDNNLYYDYDLFINGITFACIVKEQVGKSNFNYIIRELKDLKEKSNKPVIIAARHFTPDAFERFSKDGFNIVESCGNCIIIEPPLFINIKGQKSENIKVNKGRAFKESGLKLIFYFLLDDANVNKTYRQISTETGLSLGTIKIVVEELTKSFYVIKTQSGRHLNNKKELLEIWQVHLNKSLKPKLLIREMEFVDKESRKKWEDIPLPEGVCWGGESGAYMTDHYLVPEVFDIYTDVPSVKLMLTKKMLFKANGSIKVYQKFWKGNYNEKVAPKILLYADLMGSGNSRCMEAAQKLIEKWT